MQNGEGNCFGPKKVFEALTHALNITKCERLSIVSFWDGRVVPKSVRKIVVW